MARLVAASPKVSPVASAIEAAPGSRCHPRSSLPRAPSPKDIKTSAAAPMPRPAFSIQSGWLDTGSPKRNFSSRVVSSKSPQWPPTVPSSRRFQWVVGLDDIDPPPLLLGGRHDLAHDQGLV